MSDIDLILQEISQATGAVSEDEIASLARAIMDAPRIFLSGAGRSGLMMSAFANRLMHLGFCAYTVGGVTTPRAQADDLLILGSGSGSTRSLIEQAGIAKANDLTVALLTANRASDLEKFADVVVLVPTQTKESEQTESIQPMGSTFEQSLLIVLDALVLELMRRSGQTAHDMQLRHANLE